MASDSDNSLRTLHGRGMNSLSDVSLIQIFNICFRFLHLVLSHPTFFSFVGIHAACRPRGNGRTAITVEILPILLNGRLHLQRLTLQHRIWRTVVGGLYPKVLEDVLGDLLSPNEGVTPAVLDLGSGSGIWYVL